MVSRRAQVADKKEGEGLSDAAKGFHAASPYLSAVWKMVGGAVVGVGAGLLLDGWLGTRPWLTAGLSLLGISVGFYAFIHDMLKLGKKK